MRISDWSSDVCSSDLSLRYLTQAGGAMAPALTRRVHAAFPQARLFVMYGQTEASARLTRLTPERLDDKLGSVGTPIGGVEIRVRRVDGSEARSEEHTSELQSLMRNSYAVFCLKKKKKQNIII